MDNDVTSLFFTFVFNFRLNLKDYRAEHPDTELGEPGPLQVCTLGSGGGGRVKISISVKGGGKQNYWI